MTLPPDVTVCVVVDGPVGRAHRCRDALNAQTRRVDHVLVADVLVGLTLAREQRCEWIWVLERAALPARDALERLLEVADTEMPRPSVLAGLIVDPSQRPIEGRLPRGRESAVAEAVRGAAHRRVPIRRAPFASALLHVSALDEHGLPKTQGFGAYASEEWTARVLRDRSGFLVPASLAVEASPADATGVAALAALPAAARVAATGAWTRGEAAHRLAAIASRAFSR